MLKGLVVTIIISALLIVACLITIVYFLKDTTRIANGEPMVVNGSSKVPVSSTDKKAFIQLLQLVESLKNEIHHLKASNITIFYKLSKIESTNDNAIAKQLDTLKLSNDNLSNLLDVQKKKMSNQQMQINSLSTIQGKHTSDIFRLNSTDSQLFLEISRIKNHVTSVTSVTNVKENEMYCTSNISSTACLPCSCLSERKEENIYTCDCRHLAVKRDCKEFYEENVRISGIYRIRPDGVTNITVFCDQTYNGGGWVVIQKRFDGSTGFFRDWEEYKNGFGDMKREFYLGNKFINIITKSESKVGIDLETFDGIKTYARYSNFSVDSENEDFRLTVSGYSGTAGDRLSFHNGMKFSTFDRDNDKYEFSCANEHFGAWWYLDCHHINLNGVYYQTKTACPHNSGLQWNWGVSLKKSTIRIKRKT